MLCCNLVMYHLAVCQKSHSKLKIPFQQHWLSTIMLALCSMLLVTYYASNYAGIISLGLLLKKYHDTSESLSEPAQSRSIAVTGNKLKSWQFGKYFKKNLIKYIFIANLPEPTPNNQSNHSDVFAPFNNNLLSGQQHRVYSLQVQSCYT